MNKRRFNVWITKYALTKGIYEKEVQETNFKDMVSVPNSIESFHKPHWHESKEEALKQAETMRAKRIISLKKEVRKLEDLKFQ